MRDCRAAVCDQLSCAQLCTISNSKSLMTDTQHYLGSSGISLRSICLTASPRGAWYSPSGFGGLEVAGGRTQSETLLSRAAVSSPAQALQARLGIRHLCQTLRVSDRSCTRRA